jgi:phospholipid/cholesterol/gamma-HCH transport system substrate-binding protein
VNFAAIGAFVLVLGSALIAAALWLAAGGTWQKKYDLYLAVEDESVAGLNLNAPVKYNGVDVGKVQTISLDATHPQRVNLLFAIEHGTMIREDTVAMLKTQGLTGIAYVELSGGTVGSPALGASAQSRYPVIRTKPSLGTRLENVLTSVLGKLDDTSNSINGLLSAENQTAFKSILADMATVTHTLAARRTQIDAGLLDAARTLDHTAQASVQLGPLLERISRSATAIEKMGFEVARTSVSAGKTVDTVGADVKRFSVQTLPELERLLGELSALTTSLRRLSDQTERDPRGLIFGRQPIPAGPGEKGVTP